MRTILALCLLMSGWVLTSQALAQAGQGCSVFAQCPNGYSCMPLRQVCHRDGGARANEACQAGYGCARGLACEAGSQVCRAPGQVADPCHATRPCARGLSCQPGVHQCFHAPRKAGEPCVAGHGCGEGLYCQSFLQKCVAKTVEYRGQSACNSLRVQATAEDAKRANLTLSFSAGSSGGAGAYVSYETGLVYGNNGEFGCFATACAGNQSNVSVGNFANMGITSNYADFTGFSVVTNQGVDTPFLKLGFQTSQVFSAQAPRRIGDIAKNRLVGTTSGLSFGVGLSPVTVGSAICYTARLDAGDPLGDFANIEALLTGWGKLGFSADAKPQAIDGTSGTGSNSPSVVDRPVPAVPQNTVRLRSVNFPGRVLRHRNFAVELSQVSGAEMADARFKMVAGLAGRGVSFESVNFPGYFLRHQNFALVLQRNDGSNIFRLDSSFQQRPALSGGAGHSFESVNFPGHYLRHQNFVLRLAQNDRSGLFAQDASFQLVSP